MGLKYRKRMKIAPGVHLNIGKKGISSVSVGGRGASMNFNKKGHQTTVGVPGSGVSYTSKRSSNESQNNNAKIGTNENVIISSNPVTVAVLVENKKMALQLFDYLGVNYSPELRKNPWFKSKKLAQKELLKASLLDLTTQKNNDLQLQLNLEQALREFGLLRFAKKYNFDFENCSLFNAGVLVCIANDTNSTKKQRKSILEDTIVSFIQ